MPKFEALQYRVDDKVATDFLEEARRKAMRPIQRNRRRNDNIFSNIRNFLLQLIICRNF